LLARFVHHPLTSLDGMCLDLTDFEPHRSNSLIDKRAEAFGYVENDFHDEHSFDRGNESDSFSFDRDDLALQIENHTRKLCGLPPLLPAKHTQNAAVPICTHCLTSLRSNRTPKTALACFNVIGDVPHELQNLMLAEKMIIARGRVRMSILKLTPIQSHRQKALRGNVISFPQNTESVFTELEQRSRLVEIISPQQLATRLFVIFCGSNKPPPKAFIQVIGVRVAKLRVAFRWLSQHNPLCRIYLGFNQQRPQPVRDRAWNYSRRLFSPRGSLEQDCSRFRCGITN